MSYPPEVFNPFPPLRHFDACNSFLESDLERGLIGRKSQAALGVIPTEFANAWRLFRLLYLTIKWIVTHTRSGSARSESNKDRESGQPTGFVPVIPAGSAPVGCWANAWRTYLFCLAANLMRRVS